MLHAPGPTSQGPPTHLYIIAVLVPPWCSGAWLSTANAKFQTRVPPSIASAATRSFLMSPLPDAYCYLRRKDDALSKTLFTDAKYHGRAKTAGDFTHFFVFSYNNYIHLRRVQTGPAPVAYRPVHVATLGKRGITTRPFRAL